MNIKEVQIRRRETKSHLPVPVTANSVKAIGGVLVGGAPLKGIDGEMEKIIFSRYFSIDNDDRKLLEEVRNYWNNIRIKIPAEGIVLNITTKPEKIEDKTIDFPVNIKDWLEYNYILKFPKTAKDKEELENDSTKQFYIYDPEVELGKQNVDLQAKKQAFIEYSRMGKDYDKMRMVLAVLSDVDADRLNDIQVDNELGVIVENNPNKFLKVATDKKLEMKALIITLISKNIVNKYGNALYFTEQKLGDTLEEAVIFLEDKKNSAILMVLKAKLDELK
jgi:hypothetical protein